MNVSVICFGGLRDYLPEGAVGNRVELALPNEAVVGHVLESLRLPAAAVVAILADGVHLKPTSPLDEGTELTLMPPFSGGAPRTVAILTVSDRVSTGQSVDHSGPLASSLASKEGLTVVEHVVVADEISDIERKLRTWVEDGVSVVFTTGGTGFAPRDVTPEATKLVIEREAAGLVELMRATHVRDLPQAALSRAVAGIAGGTLIVNLPGSPSAVEDSFVSLAPVLEHALDLIAGETKHSHGSGRNSQC